KFTTDRISLWIVRAEVALAKTTDAGRAAIKEAFVDRERGRLIRTGIIKRVNGADPRAEGEAGLLKPAAHRWNGLILNHSRRQRFGSEGQKIGDPSRPADQLDLAAERFRIHIDGAIEDETTRCNQGTLPQIERLGKA